MAQIRSAIVALATLASSSVITPSPAMAQAAGPGASACGWVPLAGLETALGAKPRPLTGTDRSGFHSCTFAAGPTASASLQQQAPGQPGLPRDVSTGLAGARQLAGSTAKDFESQAFGAIGCYRFTMNMLGMGTTHSTTCFAPAGYLVLTLSRHDQAVPFQAVADLLKAALPHAH